MTAWEDHNNEVNYVIHTGIRVAPYYDSYRLTLSGFDFPAGTSSDSLLLSGANNINGSEFTTRQRDNDHFAYQNKGGWWYNGNCGTYARPAGYYLPQDHGTNYDGIIWDVSGFDRLYSWKALDLTLIKSSP